MRFASPSSLAPIEAPLEEDFGMGIATALVQLLELDQGWRRGHSIAVARLAALAAQHLDFSADEALALRLAALFHELGKPADPHLTLFSIDASPRARALAEQVHLLPVRLLARAATPPAVAMVLAAMYERPTGTGIPGRLSGDQVPRGAMVLAVLDAYVDRVDRVKAAPDKALAEVQISAAPLLAPQDMLALSTALSGDQQKRSVPLNVLIVDGDLDAAQALELDLLVKGFNVRVCTTTADAARAMITDGSDLVVTEVQLAPVDGFDFVQRLRADSRTRDVPVIFLTHRADPDDASHGRELGAVGYLVKPYSPEQLLETIERAFSSAPAPP